MSSSPSPEKGLLGMSQKDVLLRRCLALLKTFYLKEGPTVENSGLCYFPICLKKNNEFYDGLIVLK